MKARNSICFHHVDKLGIFRAFATMAFIIKAGAFVIAELWRRKGFLFSSMEVFVMSQSPFLNSVRELMLVGGYSRRTIDAYVYWTKRFILFRNKAHPSKLGRTK